MATDHKVLKKMIVHALSGKGAHVEVQEAFTGLDWKLTGVRPEGVSHSIFQLLNHDLLEPVGFEMARWPEACRAEARSGQLAWKYGAADFRRMARRIASAQP